MVISLVKLGCWSHFKNYIPLFCLKRCATREYVNMQIILVYQIYLCLFLKDICASIGWTEKERDFLNITQHFKEVMPNTQWHTA